jgi:hypothetical protein
MLDTEREIEINREISRNEHTERNRNGENREQRKIGNGEIRINRGK